MLYSNLYRAFYPDFADNTMKCMHHLPKIMKILLKKLSLPLHQRDPQSAQGITHQHNLFTHNFATHFIFYFQRFRKYTTETLSLSLVRPFNRLSPPIAPKLYMLDACLYEVYEASFMSQHTWKISNGDRALLMRCHLCLHICLDIYGCHKTCHKCLA